MILFYQWRGKNVKRGFGRNFFCVLSWFSIKITIFGKGFEISDKKHGVFSEENEVFCPKRLRFSTTNSSFS